MEEPREGNPTERGTACTSSLLSVATMEGSLAATGGDDVEVASARRKLRWRPAMAATAYAASRILPASMRGGVHQGSPGNGQKSVLLTPYCVFVCPCVSPPPPCRVLLATAQCSSVLTIGALRDYCLAKRRPRSFMILIGQLLPEVSLVASVQECEFHRSIHICSLIMLNICSNGVPLPWSEKYTIAATRMMQCWNM